MRTPRWPGAPGLERQVWAYHGLREGILAFGGMTILGFDGVAYRAFQALRQRL